MNEEVLNYIGLDLNNIDEKLKSKKKKSALVHITMENYIKYTSI